MRQNHLFTALRTLGLLTLILSAADKGWADEVQIGRACPENATEGQRLVEVTAESRPGKSYRLAALTDSAGDLEYLRYEGSRVGTVCFNLSDLRSNAVIMNENGRDIIRIATGRDFTAKDGGPVTMSYLANGVSGRYDRFPMHLMRLGRWQLEHEGRALDRLSFANNYGVFGILIGVKRPIPRYIR
jgi:hypothetical protein